MGGFQQVQSLHFCGYLFCYLCLDFDVTDTPQLSSTFSTQFCTICYNTQLLLSPGIGSSSDNKINLPISRLASKDVPITILMGNQQSGPVQDGRPPTGGKVESIGSLRRTGPVGPGAPRRPMPDEAELERRFNEVLLQMDLPPDRAKLLKSFDNAKKWDIICDREQVRLVSSDTC